METLKVYRDMYRELEAKPVDLDGDVPVVYRTLIKDIRAKGWEVFEIQPRTYQIYVQRRMRDGWAWMDLGTVGWYPQDGKRWISSASQSIIKRARRCIAKGEWTI